MLTIKPHNMNEQSRETVNIGYTRHRTKTNKAKNTTQQTSKMSNRRKLDITINIAIYIKF
jgi:hypothetical protein